MTPDEIRRTTLDKIEKLERGYRIAFMGAAAMEGLFFIAFLSLMNFRDRMHLLLFIGVIATYSIIALGLIALGALSNRNTQRVIQALADRAA